MAQQSDHAVERLSSARGRSVVLARTSNPVPSTDPSAPAIQRSSARNPVDPQQEVPTSALGGAGWGPASVVGVDELVQREITACTSVASRRGLRRTWPLRSRRELGLDEPDRLQIAGRLTMTPPHVDVENLAQ